MKKEHALNKCTAPKKLDVGLTFGGTS